MADFSGLELDALWTEFHDVINMTSQEIAAQLGEDDDADGADEAEETGPQVLSILQKRRTDLTDEDIRVMYLVVDIVEAQADAASGTDADATRRRHRLMKLGHDPRKAA
ncbi:DUF3140 domain-containing protein [Streptomyces sp. NPDC088116]|uniref:DUF3140 domain-containing protein n=1 Tax=Streptomyces sp. NPDC088116 TaxID=3365825 RepID=UPI0037F54B7B